MIYKTKSNSYYASEMADQLELSLQGENCEIYQPCSAYRPQNYSISFLPENMYETEQLFEKIKSFSDFLLIIPKIFSTPPPCSYLLSEEPRLDFTRMLYHFFVELPNKGIHPQAIVEKGVKIGEGVSVGAGSYLGPEASIGDHSIICSNVVIEGKVTLGRHCVVKPNTTIGSEAFNFLTDQNHLIHMPQVGEIVIGDNVWIGANTTIERATLDQTIIEQDVKIDDLVQIGDGAIIQERSEIAAGSVICTQVRIGKGCWIAPNASINSGVSIGDCAIIGMGSVVLKDVAAGIVVCGNPAKVLTREKPFLRNLLKKNL